MKTIKSILVMILVFAANAASIYCLTELSKSHIIRESQASFFEGIAFALFIFIFIVTFFVMYSINWSNPSPLKPKGSKNIVRIQMYGQKEILVDYVVKIYKYASVISLISLALFFV